MDIRDISVNVKMKNIVIEKHVTPGPTPIVGLDIQNQNDLDFYMEELKRRFEK